MPRALWRRRRTTDRPGPAGRRWAGRLRRSGTLARAGQALRVRVGRRRQPQAGGLVVSDGSLDLSRYARELTPGRTAADPGLLAPVSPAVGPTGPAPEAAGLSIPLLPGPRTAARRAKFALVNACTLSSLGLGMLAIFLAMHGHVRLAATALIACVIFDGLDGALARRLGVASPFGAQMDSLVDMCSFGLAAPVVVYASLVGSVPAGAAVVASVLVAGCAAIRLARFNVSPKDGRYFCGVPTTMAAAVLAITVLIELPLPGAMLLGGVALLAFAMVSSFPYAKLARIAKLPPWLWLAPLAGTLLDARVTFALVVAGYLVSGPLLWLHQRRAG